MDSIESETERKISKYFDEVSPPLVNFFVQCEKMDSILKFNRLLLYYVPVKHTSGFPFCLFFFQEEDNVTNSVLSNKNFSTMISILDRLPPMLSKEDVARMPDWVEDGSEKVGLEGWIYRRSIEQILDITHRCKIKHPIIDAQIHDSNITDRIVD